MRKIILLLIGAVIVIGALHVIPAKEYEIQVGQNMSYDTDLATEIEEQLKILQSRQ